MIETKENYISELNLLIERAIRKMKQKVPLFVIYTASIWTDRSAKASSINFDSKENSLRMIEHGNEFDKNYYDKYIAAGDFKSAKLFKPRNQIRFCNPADFELADFEEIEHSYVPPQWYSILVKF
jgi:hypothetical protein